MFNLLPLRTSDTAAACFVPLSYSARLGFKKVSPRGGEGWGGGMGVVPSFRHGSEAYSISEIYLEKALMCAMLWQCRFTRQTKRDLD